MSQTLSIWRKLLQFSLAGMLKVAAIADWHRSGVQRLALLDVMGAQFNDPLKPFGSSYYYCIEGFKGGP